MKHITIELNNKKHTLPTGNLGDKERLMKGSFPFMERRSSSFPSHIAKIK